jgi:hypothetical protein
MKVSEEREKINLSKRSMNFKTALTSLLVKKSIVTNYKEGQNKSYQIEISKKRQKNILRLAHNEDRKDKSQTLRRRVRLRTISKTRIGNQMALSMTNNQATTVSSLDQAECKRKVIQRSE